MAAKCHRDRRTRRRLPLLPHDYAQASANHDAAHRVSDGRTSGSAVLAAATTTPAFETQQKEPSCSPCPSKPTAPRTVPSGSW